MSPLDWELFRYPNTVFWLITYSNNFFTIYTSPRSPSNSCVIIRASNRSWFWLASANGYSCFTLRGFVGWRWGTNPNNASIPRMLGFTKRLPPTYGLRANHSHILVNGNCSLDYLTYFSQWYQKGLAFFAFHNHCTWSVHHMNCQIYLADKNNHIDLRILRMQIAKRRVQILLFS